MTSWRSRAALAVRLLLGAVFVYAAWTKLAQPWALFALSIDAYGLLPEWAVVAVARTLPWVEMALGVTLISGLLPRAAATVAAAILLLFFAVMVRSYARGLAIDCGCFGVGEALSPRTLARDGALLGAAVGLAAIEFRRRAAA